MSLLNRLTLLVVLALIPGAIIDVYNTLDLKRSREAEIHEQAKRLLVLIANEQDRLIAGIRQTLASLRQVPAIRNGNAAACTTYMGGLRADPDFPEHLDIHLIDQQGAIRCATDPAVIGISVADRLHFRRALESGRFAVSEYITKRSDGTPALPFGLPYTDLDGRPAGVISALLDNSWLNTFLAKQPLPENATLLFADRNGVVLARAPERPEIVGRPVPEHFRALMAAAERGVVEAPGLDGVERVIAYSPTHDDPQGLAIFVGIDNRTAMQEVNAVLWRALAVLAAVLLATMAAAWYGGRVLVQRPMAALLSVLERWGAGDPSARVDLRLASSEFGTLGAAFNHMADELEQRAKLREEAERRFRMEEARHRALVQTAVDALIVIDEQGTIQSWNPSAERMFGYAADEVIGRNVSMLMPEPYRSGHDQYLERYRATGERRIIGIGREVMAQRKDGSVFPVDLAVAEWRADNVRYYTGFIRDITQRKAGEEAIVAAKDGAERANAAKTRFLAAASHDLRQPVQSLFLFRSALEMKVNDPGAQKIIENMEGALNALRLILDGLVDISKLEAGVVTITEEEFPVAPLLDRLVKEYAQRAAVSGVRLRFVRTSVWVRSDPGLLERILRNLVENAIKHAAPADVLIGCRRHGDRVRLEVVDQGPGIPVERHGEIFQEFVQLGNPERDRAKGLGLGLAIMRRLADLLGHQVRVRSHPGRGSCFSVEVPVAAPRTVEASRPQVANENASGTALVIDDEVLVLMGMRAMLESWGWRVLTAVSSEEAVTVVTGEHVVPDVILADYRLRENLTGVQAIQDVERVCGTRIPAIIITGDTSPERIAEAQRSGRKLMHKPVSPFTLRAVLNETRSASSQ